MAKLTLSDLTTIVGNETSAVAALNANWVLIEAALENTLSRDGTTPNSMSASIDLNNFDLLNVDAIDVKSITIDGISVISMLPTVVPRGDWVTATAYVVGDLVTGDATSVTYICNTAHTSGTFATDRDNNGYWTIFATPPANIEEPEEFSGDGADTTFVLSKTPDDEKAILIFIDGVYQQHTTFSLSSATITFSEAPATGTNNIAVWYTTGSGVTPAGDVVGPGSAVDNTVARFNLTTGLIIQGSGVVIADTTDAMSVGAGTASLPGLSWLGDTDTGFYRPAVNQISVANAGAQSVTFTGAAIRNKDGSNTLPAFTFLDDTDTGMYRIGNNDLGWSLGGTKSLELVAGTLLNLLGSAASPSYSFIGDTDTGIYRGAANEVHFANAGAQSFVVAGGSIRIKDGTAGSPSLRFLSDLDTGLYNIAANNIGVTVGGTKVMDIAGTAVDIDNFRSLRTFTAAEDVADGELCYINASGEMALADADLESTADTILWIAQAAVSSAASGVFMLNGVEVTSGLTAGAPYYVSNTPGGITATPPVGSGDIIRHIGTALSTTELLFDGGPTSWVEAA